MSALFMSRRRGGPHRLWALLHLQPRPSGALQASATGRAQMETACKAAGERMGAAMEHFPRVVESLARHISVQRSALASFPPLTQPSPWPHIACCCARLLPTWRRRGAPLNRYNRDLFYAQSDEGEVFLCLLWARGGVVGVPLRGPGCCCAPPIFRACCWPGPGMCSKCPGQGVHISHALPQATSTTPSSLSDGAPHKNFWYFPARATAVLGCMGSLRTSPAPGLRVA